jgi:putative membrane protein
MASNERGARVAESRRPRGLLARVLVSVGVNMLALAVVDALFSGVSIGRWWPLIAGAAVLGFANSFLKPALAFVAFPLIVVTLGLAYFALNVAMLALAAAIAPDFSINGFGTYVGATIVVWLVNVSVQRLIGGESGGRRTRRHS